MNQPLKIIIDKPRSTGQEWRARLVASYQAEVRVFFGFGNSSAQAVAQAYDKARAYWPDWRPG